MKSAITKVLELGNALIPDDGDVVIWSLAEPFLGRVTTRPGLLDEPKLAFFRNGQLVNKYALKTLVVRPYFTESIEHTCWLATTSAKSHVNPYLHGNQLYLKTDSGREYTFNIRDGKMLSAQDSAEWKLADVVVFGRVATTGFGRFKISDYVLLKGTLPDKDALSFSDRTNQYTLGRGFLFLVKQPRGWKAVSP